MPKKKKKRKVKRKTSKKKSVRRKVKRKTSKKKSVRRKAKRKASKNKKNENRDSPAELIIKSKPEWIRASLASKAQYQKKYSESIKNNDNFWKKEGKRITWIKPYKKIKEVKYSSKDVKIK